MRVITHSEFNCGMLFSLYKVLLLQKLIIWCFHSVQEKSCSKKFKKNFLKFFEFLINLF